MNSHFKYFFLNEPNLFVQGNRFKKNPRIVKFDPATFWISECPLPKPSFNSINDLIKKDKRFVDYRKQRPNTWKFIIEDDIIIDLSELIFTGERDDEQAGNMLLHLINGAQNGKQFSGVHYMPNPIPSMFSDFKEIAPIDSKGVSIATFKMVINDKVREKENGSSLFPRNWSPQKLYDECLYALNNKVIDSISENIYRSQTISGIPVIIHFNSTHTRISTLYPIHESDYGKFNIVEN